MRVIVLAGGNQERFTQSMSKSTESKHKHLISILGEPILHRTIRLLLTLGCEDIVVVVPQGLLEEYTIFKSPFVGYFERSEPIKQKLLEADMFLSKSDENLIVLGDVFFTRRSLQKMLEPLQSLPFAVYCRHNRSRVNAKTYGEIFAINISSGSQNLIIESAKLISIAFSEGKLYRDNIWEVVKLASGVAFENLGEHPILPCYIEINDFTDDIDYASDIEIIKESLPQDFEAALDKLSELHELIYLDQIRHDLLRAEHNLLRTEHDLLFNTSLELSFLKESLSWRLTRPLRSIKSKILTPLLRISKRLSFDDRGKFTVKQFFIEAWRYVLARFSGISQDEWERAFPSEVFRHLPEHNKALHIGGHLGREYDAYEDVLFIEPFPKYARYLRSLRRKVIEASCCGNDLYITTYEQASSNLMPLEHKVKSRITTLNLTLDEINGGIFDLLVIDAQGSELNILKSGCLSFNSIIVECSIKPRYAGAPTKKEVIEFLESKNYSLDDEFQHGNHDIYDLVFNISSLGESAIEEL
jgi:molybdopterin-guanine dinucleotide biosynthesis protein A